MCSSSLHFLLQPLFLNEVLVKMPPDPSSDEPLFHVSHIDRVYTLRTETLNERYAMRMHIFTHFTNHLITLNTESDSLCRQDNVGPENQSSI